MGTWLAIVQVGAGSIATVLLAMRLGFTVRRTPSRRRGTWLYSNGPHQCKPPKRPKRDDRRAEWSCNTCGQVWKPRMICGPGPGFWIFERVVGPKDDVHTQRMRDWWAVAEELKEKISKDLTSYDKFPD